MKMRLLIIVIIGFLLRVVALGNVPTNLYSDEAAFGYNAYLLLTSRHDEFGRFWPMALESFGDWKPPMQAWLAIPFIKIFGLNESAVRLPSALLGTATIVVVYFLSNELFQKKLFVDSWRLPVGEIASMLLAISPWHIQMSRMAMLVSIEVFFVSLGVLGLLKGLSNGRWWVVSAASFAGAMYSYYGSRITVPLILFSFLIIFRREILLRFRSVIVSTLVGIAFLSPLLFAATRNPLVLTGRARTTSIFFNDNVRLQLWDAHTKAGLQHITPIVSRFFDNKPYYYTKDIIQRYFSHFSPSFLFFRGDRQAPFTIPGLGVLYLVEAPLFLVGLLVVRRQLIERSKRHLFLFFYLLLAPLVASLTFMTPASNRSFNLVVPWVLFSSVGLAGILSWSGRFVAILSVVIAVSYSASLGYFFFQYAIRTPIVSPRQWYIGEPEMVRKLKPMLSQFDNIIMTGHGGPPYIFLASYLPIPYDDFRRTIRRNPDIDELGWEHVDQVLNVRIVRDFSWEKVPKLHDTLYVGFENELPHDKIDLVGRVYYPNGSVAYEMGVLKYWVTE